MTNKTTVSDYHRIISPLIGLAVCMALMPSMKGVARTTTAAGPTTNLAEQFTGEALGASDGERAGRIQIYISQWSSDAEVQRLREPFERADAGSLLSMLHDQHRRAGVVLMPGIQAHGTRSRTHKDVQEFNLLDIRFGLDGNGVGKIVSSADIAFSAKTGMIEVKDFSNHPSRLIDVRAQKP